MGFAIAHPVEFDRFGIEQAEELDSLFRFHSDHIAYDDLISEAWLLATELGVARNFPFDFRERNDQALLLSELKTRIRRLTRRRYVTMSLDQPIAANRSQAEAVTWYRILAAPECVDPLNILIQADFDEPDIDWLEVARASYSEVSAYILLLVRFDWDRKQLATFLAISAVTLIIRLGRAIDVIRRQPSLFDGFEAIEEGFRARTEHRSTQRKWTELNKQLALIDWY